MAERALGRLSLDNAYGLPEPVRPLVDAHDLSVGVVHPGVGAFHRAHQVVYTEKACELGGEHSWGICGVSERSPSAAELLSAQDGLYCVFVPGPEEPSLRVGETPEIYGAEHLLIRRAASPEVARGSSSGSVGGKTT